MTTRSCGSRCTLFTAGKGETSCPFMPAGASLPRGCPPCPLNWLSPRERETANRQPTCCDIISVANAAIGRNLGTARYSTKETENLYIDLLCMYRYIFQYSTVQHQRGPTLVYTSYEAYFVRIFQYSAVKHQIDLTLVHDTYSAVAKCSRGCGWQEEHMTTTSSTDGKGS